jgi:hypothetical protein
MPSLKNAELNQIDMKRILTILFIVLASTAFGQSKKAMEAMSNARMLERIMFETKDPARLDVLTAKTLSFTDQNGNASSDNRAKKNIIALQLESTIQKASPYDVKEVDGSTVIKHTYYAIEKGTDNKEAVLAVSVESTWIKEDGKLKLASCKLVKL